MPPTDSWNADVAPTPVSATPVPAAADVPLNEPTPAADPVPPAPTADTRTDVVDPVAPADVPAQPAAPAATLPEVGKLVAYDAVDPVTGADLTGVGLVVQAFTTGVGDQQIARVALAQLPATLYLDAADVEAL